MVNHIRLTVMTTILYFLLMFTIRSFQNLGGLFTVFPFVLGMIVFAGVMYFIGARRKEIALFSGSIAIIIVNFINLFISGVSTPNVVAMVLQAALEVFVVTLVSYGILKFLKYD